MELTQLKYFKTCERYCQVKLTEWIFSKDGELGSSSCVPLSSVRLYKWSAVIKKKPVERHGKRSAAIETNVAARYTDSLLH